MSQPVAKTSFYLQIKSIIRYVVQIPKNLPMDVAAPLLCAGLTVFTPLKDSGILSSPGNRLGVIGLGGLGHLAVKFKKAFGLHVTVISKNIVLTKPTHFQVFFLKRLIFSFKNH